MRITDNSTRRINYPLPNPEKKTVVREEYSKSPLEDEHTQEANNVAEEVKGDSVEISSEAIQKSKDIDDEMRKMSDELKNFNEQLEIARKQSQAAGKMWETLIKCLKIAMRIMSGDIVPRADHRYLAKNEPEMYAKAITMRMNKDNPKKHKRLSDKDDSDKVEKKDGKRTETPANSPVEAAESNNGNEAEEEQTV